MQERTFAVRPAEPEDDPAIAALVVEGFLDKFRPIFRSRIDQSVDIMEKWVRLEHSIGGVSSLVVETSDGVVASVGVRLGSSEDETLSRALWSTLRKHLGLMPAVRAAALLSYPRYTPRRTEAYVERLVVSSDHRHEGMARTLLHEVEDRGRREEKATVALHVTNNNHAALKLYESEGYGEVSRQRSLLTSYSLGIKSWLYLRKNL